MEGFNLIPQTGNNLPENQNNSENLNSEIPPESAPESISIKNKKIKVLTEKNSTIQQNTKVESIFFVTSCVVLFAVFAYNGFLFYQRYDYLNKMQTLSNNFSEISKNIDRQELEDFTILNTKLNSIQERLSKHILFTDVFDLVNQNMRSSIQLSEYRIDSTENELIATYSCVAPSFKDMAEQAEKLLELKKNQEIKSFSLTGLSYEQDTKRVRFTIKILLEKSRFSAINYVNSNQN